MRFVMEDFLTEAQAVAQGFIKVAEASKLSGLDRTTINRRCENGGDAALPHCWVKRGSRPGLWVLKSALVADSTESDYQTIIQKWEADMLAGNLNQKRKRLSPKYLESLKYGFDMYWGALGVKPSIAEITVANFQKVMLTFPDDEEAMNDAISRRLHVFKACTSLLRMLVRDGFRPESDLEKFRKEKPHSKYTKERDWLEDYEVVKAIDFNKQWINGRSSRDILVFNLFVHLYSYAGFRLLEAARCKVEDIDFKKRIIKARGKGGKERLVIPLPLIWPTLEQWVNSPLCNKKGLLIPNKQGGMHTKSSIDQKFSKFSKAFRKKNDDAPHVHPHALRCAFAIMWSNKGMPLRTLQKILGHQSINTTMGYLPTTIQHGLQWVEDNIGPIEATGFGAEQMAAPVESEQLSDNEILKRLLGQ